MVETTNMSNKELRTHEYAGPKIDITVGKTTIKMDEGFDEGSFSGCCNLLVMRDGTWLPARKVVITLELEQPPKIEMSYIEGGSK